jgi:hypothetical protein
VVLDVLEAGAVFSAGALCWAAGAGFGAGVFCAAATPAPATRVKAAALAKSDFFIIVSSNEFPSRPLSVG